MSIQDTKKLLLKRRLLNKLGLERYITLPQLALEKIKRAVDHDPLNVYFRYQHINLDLHPWFNRYYKYPPIKYCNFNQANIYHWISYPDIMNNKPFIVEPNDHPLSVVGALKGGFSEPKDIIKNRQKAIDLVYLNPACKKIIVESSGQLELFERYCPEILYKCEILRIGTIPKKNYLKTQNQKKSLVFLCLASDFKKKAIDLILDSWFNFPDKKKHKLVIACPNIPKNYMEKAKGENIKIILKAPLSEVEKDELHRNADIAIGPLHIDGGSNLLEGMEYGLPFITMRSQRSNDQMLNNSGIVVDVPFYFYDKGYGLEWPTWDSFYMLLEEAKSRGEFDKTKQGFIDAFTFFSQNPDKISEMSEGSYDLATNEYSLKKRNKRLKEIYQEILLIN
jgi:hypothetical protein